MDDIDWNEEIEAFDATSALREVRINWLKLARTLSAAVEGSSDWACEGPKEADEAIAFAARAEACLWRASGDCEAIDADKFVPQLRTTPTGETHHG